MDVSLANNKYEPNFNGKILLENDHFEEWLYGMTKEQ